MAEIDGQQNAGSCREGELKTRSYTRALTR